MPATKHPTRIPLAAAAIPTCARDDLFGSPSLVLSSRPSEQPSKRSIGRAASNSEEGTYGLTALSLRRFILNNGRHSPLNCQRGPGEDGVPSPAVRPSPIGEQAFASAADGTSASLPEAGFSHARRERVTGRGCTTNPRESIRRRTFMNPWICALLITVAAAISGGLNALMTDNGVPLPHMREWGLVPRSCFNYSSWLYSSVYIVGPLRLRCRCGAPRH